MFLQPDPAGYTDGVDHYAGFGHNPINLRDPTGTATGEGGEPFKSQGAQFVEYGKREGGVMGFIDRVAGYGMEAVGAVLPSGTAVAEGSDLLNSKRPGAWGVLDRLHGGRLVTSELQKTYGYAQFAVVAGPALYVVGSA